MRRRSVEVWPAFADLMTILAVVSLAGLLLAEARRRGDHTALEECRAEKARNEAMARAIDEAQALVEEISKSSDLDFAADQTLQFGDDLVGFDLNGVVPHWQLGARERLHRFCAELSRQARRLGASGESFARLFTVHVEGHTDSSVCWDDPDCNWRISSARAASFVGVMRGGDVCPGGRDWDLRPEGFADTRPLRQPSGSLEATRRIALRLVPNYEAILQTAVR